MRLRHILPALLAVLVFAGAGCSLFAPIVKIVPVTLEYWRADDTPHSMADIIAAYEQIHPNVTINYRQFRADEIGQKLIDAFAEDRGPDLFSLPNVRLREFRDLLLPLPKTTVVPTQTVNAQNQVVAVKQQNTAITKRALISSFVEAVPGEVVLTAPATPSQPAQEAIYGLPLSVDSLGLFYNKDLLKKANLDKPPATWSEFQYQVGKLTTLDNLGQILQSGASIGTVKNVRYAVELLSVLMSQYGAQMADANGNPDFQAYPAGADTSQELPAAQALEFYDSFATPGSGTYCWNDSMPDSLDAFVTGKTAFYFGFPADTAAIRARSPKLNFGVASLPQYNPERQYNAAVFPIEVVSKKTKSPNESWDFLQFAAQADHVKSFLAATGRPTALRALIVEQSTNPDVGPFVSQLLTARSWYKGVNYPKLAGIFAEMAAARPDPLQSIYYATILNQAAEGVAATMKAGFNP